MAGQKKRYQSWDESVARAAEDVRRVNPHIGEEPRAYPDDAYAELAESIRQLERIWEEMDRVRGNKPQSYTAVDAVNADRGE